MAHLYIPLDGVPIVPSPPTADFIAADGYVVFALSVRQFYAYNQALGIWQPAGGGIIVADTDSIDLTDTAGTLTADVRISSDAAPAGNVKATITVQSGASPGLLAVVAESDIKALFSVTDTDSLDLTYTSGVTSGDVRLSSNAADAGSQLVNLNVESSVSKGLRAQISNTAIRAALSVTDTDSIDMTYSSGAFSSAVIISPAAADAGNQKVNLDVQTGANKGLRAQIPNTAIQNALSVTDTNSLDLTYATGALSGDVRLSANAADANNQKVNLDIQSTSSVGVRAQIPNSSIQAALSVTDTDSVDMSYSSGAFSSAVRLSSDAADASNTIVGLAIRSGASPGLRAQIANSAVQGLFSATDTNSVDMVYSAGAYSANVRLSSNAADAGSTIVGLSIQSSGTVGLRAQVANTAIQGLFSATAPIQYSAGAFTFDTATTTLTAYLLKTGGTMTGAIISSIPYANNTVVSTSLQPAAWYDVSHLQSTTLTFDATKGECFKFSINAESHAGMEVCAFYKHGLLTILTDQENKYQEADSGSGWYIAKGNNTGVITIKSRLGGTHKVLINVKEGVLSSATAWA